ncbi:DUF1624 domain-containing protein [Catenovulum sp. SM1970]|uniref:heparan-alpha-glucosaminide N-acetyltransferase domain-containing protein n=1 Tax=Marinifaba aquimaris TaxID=2741323 RepID=UPI001571794F|nr:heparan-alpha-glucosaminide N-acetyltransferase domain-containing protein [Marinifaba aquimaris]NTS78841.1 DUF1624 domain-containing protein [Marinifaba aquimaris]
MTTKTTTVSQTQAPSSRVLGFDLARGFAVFFMIIIHVLNFYGSPEVHEGYYGATVKFLLGWPAASLFIFLMGVFVAFSKQGNLTTQLKRAAALFALGYLLNLFRSTIPTWLSIQFGFVTYEQLGPHTPINSLFVVDILQCAGLAYGICAIVRHYFSNAKVWLVLAVVVAFISPLLWDVKTGIGFVDQVLKIFVGNKSHGALFPLFPWLAYPLAGMAFGYWFKSQADRNKAFKQTLLIGIVTLVAGIAICLTNPEYHIVDNMRSGPGLIVGLSGLVLVFLCLFQWLTMHFGQSKLFSLLYGWSQNITTIYCIHWLIIGWCLMIFGALQMSLTSLIIWTFAVVVLSDIVCRIWLKINAKSAKKLAIQSNNHGSLSTS